MTDTDSGEQTSKTEDGATAIQKSSGAPERSQVQLRHSNLEAAKDEPKSPMCSDAPIWDENNKLVDPELDRHFKEESAKVLGEIKSTPPETTPEEAQAKEEMTKDPMTSPEPSHDLNQRPSKIGSDETEEKDG